jgi:hypothetical protein
VINAKLLLPPTVAPAIKWSGVCQEENCRAVHTLESPNGDFPRSLAHFTTTCQNCSSRLPVHMYRHGQASEKVN